MRLAECWPDEYVPLYGCCLCCVDFVSEDAFDRHRVGDHAHDFSPDHSDGRRCLGLDELGEVGLRVLDGDELAASKYAARARFGVVLVFDPAAPERARLAFRSPA